MWDTCSTDKVLQHQSNVRGYTTCAPNNRAGVLLLWCQFTYMIASRAISGEWIQRTSLELWSQADSDKLNE